MKITIDFDHAEMLETAVCDAILQAEKDLCEAARVGSATDVSASAAKLHDLESLWNAVKAETRTEQQS